MSRRRLGTRRALNFSGGTSAPATLPVWFPKPSVSRPTLISLPSYTFTSTALISSTLDVPFQANVINVNGTFMLGNSAWIYIWCDTINFNTGYFSPSIQDGSDAFTAPFVGCCDPGDAQGGIGGDGGSGGGGGGAMNGNFAGDNGPGGAGGTGAAGNPGGSLGSNCSAGAGGAGSAATYTSGIAITLPNGGNGDGLSAAGGLGGQGFGGAGSGGYTYLNSGTIDQAAGGGGGGGGGLAIIVARIIQGLGNGYANGGSGGLGSIISSNAPPSYAENASGGGGGVIVMFASKYDGNTTLHVQGGFSPWGCCQYAQSGNYQLNEVNKAGDTVLAVHNNTNPSWNHL